MEGDLRAGAAPSGVAGAVLGTAGVTLPLPAVWAGAGLLWAEADLLWAVEPRPLLVVGPSAWAVVLPTQTHLWVADLCVSASDPRAEAVEPRTSAAEALAAWAGEDRTCRGRVPGAWVPRTRAPGLTWGRTC